MFRKKLWPREKLIDLSALLFQHPALWQRSHEDYKKKPARKDALKEIAHQLKYSSEVEVERKIKNIIGQFNRERKKEVGPSGSGGNTHQSKWFLYPKLFFLRDIATVRKTLNSTDAIGATIVEEIIEQVMPNIKVLISTCTTKKYLFSAVCGCARSVCIVPS